MLALLISAALLSGSSYALQAAPAQLQTSPAPQTTAEKSWPPQGVVRLGQGVKAPRLLKDVKPRYTPDAMQAGIEGIVTLEAVIRVDGTVGDVRVTRSLDREFGLDAEAISALKKWEFAAGTKDDVAVPVLVEIEMSFKRR
jgi:periplasmic protein TonB